VAGVLAALSCAAVLTLSACDTSKPAPSGGGSSEHGEEHGGTHPTEHGGTHPSSEHRTTVPPSSRPSEYDPNNCPTGLVC
jgi:hypothetical protein